MLRKLLAVAALMTMPIAAAQAQLNFGIGAGASLPSGAIKSYTETGYHFLATAGIHPPLAPVGFRVDGMFNQFNGTAADTKTSIMGLNANAVLSMPGAIVLSPYVIGGAGTYRYKATGPTAGSTFSSNEVGVNVGAGIKFGLAGFGAFAEARYHALMNDGTDKIRFIPITFGIIF